MSASDISLRFQQCYENVCYCPNKISEPMPIKVCLCLDLVRKSDEKSSCSRSSSAPVGAVQALMDLPIFSGSPEWIYLGWLT